MRTFVLKTFLYGSLVLLLHLVVARYANGITDAYYLRFTSSPKKHLIIGTSKAAQGLRPEYLNEVLALDEDNGFFNYAFTLGHSPYGSVYRESILRKVDASCQEGVFIICVDPWSISGLAIGPEDVTQFNESNKAVGTTHFVNMNPNYEYLLENYPHGWFKLLWKHISPSPSITQLHNDGWFSVDVPMDSVSVAQRTARKVITYRKNKKRFAPSSVRRAELEKTIDQLKEHGSVYLIRLPIGKEIVETQEGYMPDFEEYIGALSDRKSTPYLDLRALPDTFRYTDGNHLYSESAISVSRIVGEFIREHR